MQECQGSIFTWQRPVISMQEVENILGRVLDAFHVHMGSISCGVNAKTAACLTTGHPSNTNWGCFLVIHGHAGLAGVERRGDLGNQ